MILLRNIQGIKDTHRVRDDYLVAVLHRLAEQGRLESGSRGGKDDVVVDQLVQLLVQLLLHFEPLGYALLNQLGALHHLAQAVTAYIEIFQSIV